MEKDWTNWTVNLNRHYMYNWSIGLDYYVNNPDTPALMAKVLQINLLFFNITITKWYGHKWI